HCIHSDVVKELSVAAQPGHQLPQGLSARELGVSQRRELAPKTQRPFPVIPPMLFNETLEAPPRYRFQQPVNDRILMVHGRGSVAVSKVAKPSKAAESLPCTASTKIPTGQQWDKPE